MSLRSKLVASAVLLWAAVLLTLSWASAALAEVGEDGDGFDGDELLSLPLVIGLGLLAALAWNRYRNGSRRSEK